MNYRFGVDYYPEHWPEDRWETDARLMAEMGLKVVRLAEFAWRKMESAPGRYNFDWLERVIDILSRNGLKAILGTPTAAPPAWLVELHPEILPVDSTGTRRGFGGRHHDCQSNPDYRTAAAGIVGAMADRFGSDSRVAGWQVDNELGNSHKNLCHCVHCRRAFQSWLENRYGIVERLNAAWGTDFWSQAYDRFGQIDTPKLTPNAHSPALILDWKRFHSDLIVEFQRNQIAILRGRAKDQFITHNCMGFFDLVDYFDLAESLDFVSHDQYPTGYWETPPGRCPEDLAATLDLMAALKRRTFWVMEQQSGPTGWQIMGRTPKRGQLALWTAQSIARGADTVVFFRWRSCTVGTEQFWHGILPHDGVPGARYQELKAFIASMGTVMPRFEGALNMAEVAVVHSYEQNWALEIQPHHPDLDYVRVSQDIYRALFERNIPVAYVSPESDLTPYKLVIAPPLFLDIPGVAARLEAYVQAGGQLVLLPRTGVKNYENACLTGAPLPGPYAELLGIHVLDYDCLRDAETKVVADGAEGLGLYWWDGVTVKSATPLFTATGAEHSGEPAMTMNRYGEGIAWYVATFPDRTLMRAMAARWIAAAGVRSLGESPPGVELVRRKGPGGEFLFALNHTGESLIHDPGAGWEHLVGTARLEPYGIAVLVKKD